MITAHPVRCCQWVFNTTLRRAFRRRFFKVSATAAPEFDPARPVLLLPNHSNCWDGFLSYWLARHWSGRYPCGMMDETEMRLFPHYRHVGIFSVNRHNRRFAGASLRHAARLLERPGPWMILFPQGEQLPASAPLRLEPGAAWLWKHNPEVQVITAAFRYVFLYDTRPQILVSTERLTPPADGDSLAARTELIATSLRRQLDQLDARFNNQDFTGMETVLSGRPSLHHRWARLRQLFTFRRPENG
ncbi:MAG: lysophospholipid acyltransferase family protein [Verrucomicrobia bacterium]|nr:lysophospholipid acyltransferase family protein [Verrucomicrobiota bacterium]